MNRVPQFKNLVGIRKLETIRSASKLVCWNQSQGNAFREKAIQTTDRQAHNPAPASSLLFFFFISK